MEILIAGGGAAGLLASLLLARAGHDVLVAERDRFDASLDLERAAAAAFRPAAPHIVQPHAVMARCRGLLQDRLPDVYARLMAAGVVEAPVRAFMPPSLADTTPRPGDERLTALLSRRSTLDWVLRRSVLDEPRVRLRQGVRALGLTSARGNPPRVTGLRTSHGDIAADLVIDATGRRSGVSRWLSDITGRQPYAWRAECGLAYFGRHYRARSGARIPGRTSVRLVSPLEEFTAVLFGADNNAMQLAIAPLAADRRFAAVRRPEVFAAVLRTIPAFAAWLEVLDPISEVYPMAGLDNTLRRLVVDGTPVAVGLHSVGDASCTTNPTLGRGLSLAMVTAAGVCDTIERCPGDLVAQALAHDELVAEHVAPYYEDQVAIDGRRLGMLRHAVMAAPDPVPPPASDDRVTYAEVRTAGEVDPVAFRAFWRIQGMISAPEQVYADPVVVAATRAALAGAQPPPAAQPSRDQLLAALSGG